MIPKAHDSLPLPLLPVKLVPTTRGQVAHVASLSQQQLCSINKAASVGHDSEL